MFESLQADATLVVDTKPALQQTNMRQIFEQNSYKVNYSNSSEDLSTLYIQHSMMSFLVVAYHLENKPIIVIIIKKKLSLKI